MLTGPTALAAAVTAFSSSAWRCSSELSAAATMSALGVSLGNVLGSATLPESKIRLVKKKDERYE
jgi:hypothetical protein